MGKRLFFAFEIFAGAGRRAASSTSVQCHTWRCWANRANYVMQPQNIFFSLKILSFIIF